MIKIVQICNINYYKLRVIIAIFKNGKSYRF